MRRFIWQLILFAMVLDWMAFAFADYGDGGDKIISISVPESIAPSVNACIVAAAEKIEGSTCLTFNIDYGAGAALDKQPAMRQNEHDGYGYGFERNGTIYIQDLACGYSKENNTVYLSTKCISDDVCFKLIGAAITSERLPTQNVISSINARYCPEERYCKKVCQNSGELKMAVDNSFPPCYCHCTDLIFDGSNCEHIHLQNSVLCSSIDKNATEGHIGLNQSIAAQGIGCMWVLKGDDPWDTFELTIDDLDIGLKTSGHHNCPDVLAFHGVKNHSSIVECDPEELNGWIGKVLRSEGNVVGISQLTNPFVRRDRIGVQISYRKIGPTTYGSTDTVYISSSAEPVKNGVHSSAPIKLLLNGVALTLFIAFTTLLSSTSTTADILLF